MAQVIWTEPALSDLENIAEYIVLSNVDAAQQLVKIIFNKTERLEQHPMPGVNHLN